MSTASDPLDAIAVIGIAARFPDASSYNRFWENLLAGQESISFFPGMNNARYIPAKSIVSDADCFDADFFSISSREASLMDPQARLLLQSAWHALEDAGYMPHKMPGRVGVFAASSFNTYQHLDGWFSNYWKQTQDTPAQRFTAYTGTIADTLATRISYKLNLIGPSMTVQTACSSSLVALHLGCQSLLLGESDCVLVGASSLSFPMQEGYVYEEGMVFSRDGHCRSFDKAASGTVFGNGVACVVLKPLASAIRDQDHIYGVIRGSALNNDGARKVDFNAPSVIGQKEVIQSAHAVAGVRADEISYIEAHGTGTLVGDPIELKALQEVFAHTEHTAPFCGIGAVKTNLGHLDAASGMASLLKVLLSFEYEQIPATLHFKEINPHIEWKNSPFFIIDRPLVWKRDKKPRYAAVTNLGIGGTNAHVVLQEAPLRAPLLISNELLPFTLSADSLEQLNLYLQHLLIALQDPRFTGRLEDVLFTLMVSRVSKKYKCIGVVGSLLELEQELTAYLHKRDTALLCISEKTDAKKLESFLGRLTEKHRQWWIEYLQGKEDAPLFQGHRISLPGYPFAKNKYWFDHVLPSLADCHSSGSSNQLLVNTQLSFVKDHVIEGKHLFPATGFLSFVFDMYSQDQARERFPFCFEDVSFVHPLEIEGSAWLHLKKMQDQRFQCMSETSQVYCEGRVVPLPLQSVSQLSMAALLQDASEISCDQPYEHYKTQGIEYGPSFQLLSKLYKSTNGSVIARLEGDIRAESLSYPPQMVDAAFHAALGLAYGKDPLCDLSDGFVPVFIQRATFYAPIESLLYIVLAPKQTSRNAKYPFLEYTIRAYNAQGLLIFALEGVKEQKIAKKKNKGDLQALLSWFARAMAKKEEEIDLDAPLEKYNIDSVLAISLADQIAKVFCPCSKSVFFEFYTLRELFAHLMSTMNTHQEQRDIEQEGNSSATYSVTSAAMALVPKAGIQKRSSSLDLAIVGLSGYYPDSSSVYELWHHLTQGDNLITEVPKERWDHSLYFSEVQGEIGKTYSRWGGFLKNLDLFDPAFFKLSPREAALLDPQERLFLQVSWAALEDAGYTPSSLGKKTHHAVGVYVGAMYQEYQLFGIEERVKGNPVILNGIMSTIPNRVSYFCDFRGPSLAVDTMCSSALTALYLACQDLRAGRTKAALVGGVNVTVHPNKYLQLAQERILADDGLCKSFGLGGIGYVPSEGVGAILIKPLEDAERDRDHIYGVIRGIQINHGGKTNSFTVPNAKAQSSLISSVLQESGVSAEQISYVEAHGTGTTLGDPIEIRALTEAFGALSPASCAIGSIKSNLGHTESNAGLAGLTKILLQMKHRLLVPSIHSESLNPHINFSQTPFRVQRHLEYWESVGRPRIAALSSFGAGGSNGHLVIEEGPVLKGSMISEGQVVLVPLSARSVSGLKKIAGQLIHALAQPQHSLGDIAFTLSVGREPFSYRAALVVSSMSQCVAALEALLEDRVHKGLFVTAPSSDMLVPHLLGRALQEQDWDALARHWVQGGEIDWETYYTGRNEIYARVPLPTYPFEEIECRFNVVAPDKAKGSIAPLHPLLHKNITTFKEYAFSALLQQNHPLLRDHRVAGSVVLPGAAYIEMALSAVKALVGQSSTSASLQVRFVKPCYLTAQDREVLISLVPAKGVTRFEIWARENQKESIFCQGEVSFIPRSMKQFSVPFNSSLGAYAYTKEMFYQKLREVGLDYGPGYQLVSQAMLRGEEVVAYAELPPENSRKELILHPALLDAAFQSTAVFDFPTQASYTYVPSGIRACHSYAPLSQKVVIHIVRKASSNNGSRTYDLTIADEQGNVCLLVEGFEEKPLRSIPTNVDEPSTVCASAFWRQQDALISTVSPLPSVCVVTTAALAAQWKQRGNDRVVEIQEGDIEGNLLMLFEFLKQTLIDRKEQRLSVIVLLELKEAWQGTAFLGLFKTIGLEYPFFLGKVVLLEQFDQHILDREKRSLEYFVRYSSEGREVQVFEPVDLIVDRGSLSIVRPEGVYLITGGSGGLGRVFVQHFVAKQVPCLIVITGTKLLEEDAFAHWGDERVQVRYYRCDVTERKEIIDLIDRIRAELGVLRGVLHLAGINRDSLFARKTKEDFQRVLKPKISGTLLLDEVTAELPLDFFILFSSDSSVLGNVGQSDYAAANAFLDGFAVHRNQLCSCNQRHGVTKAINWSYWKEGGMGLSTQDQARLYEETGSLPWSNQEGQEVFDKILLSPFEQVIPLRGNHEKIHASLLDMHRKKQQIEHPARTKESTEELRSWLRALLKQELQIQDQGLLDTASFEELGIDSVLGMNIISQMEKRAGRLPKTLFFEHPTFADLLKYFTEQVSFSLQGALKEETPSVSIASSKPVTSIRSAPVSRREKSAVDIAIIGMAGKYPQTDSVEELWERLVRGDNCIEEVPADRFDVNAVFSSHSMEGGKTRSKWGGFLKDIFSFDPLFFKLSPADAERSDPQEKLFVQTTWHALEDAGYSRERLIKTTNREVGVYVGSMYQEYQLYNAEQILLGNPLILEGSASTIPNRVSYFLDITGPSMAIDTMCSSALTALYLACNDLVLGKCKMAIAGGVNVSVHRNKYLTLSFQGFLSTDGLCKSFGKGGDGYVPSEGVGAVILKPLEDALRDHDRIYGVIKGIDINHGGKASGFTVPSASAQTKAIQKAFEQSSVPLEEISYIEAHGTGTALGDPIEISGLQQVFSAKKDGQRIPIGSIKSNIGHTEAAAGVAALTKVLLQMRHGQLVPSLHSQPPNPFIDFEALPFAVQTGVREWNVSKKAALISSFGAGGSNAALVLEEHPVESLVVPEHRLSFLFVVSALNQDRLRAHTQNLLDFLLKTTDPTFSLSSFIYTLQVGREAFASRLAIVFKDRYDLQTKLGEYLAGKKPEGVHVTPDKQLLSELQQMGLHEEFKEFLSTQMSSFPIQQIGKLWAQGSQVDWEALYAGTRFSIMSLPRYPFASIRCWCSLVPLPEKIAPATTQHSLLHQNTSDVKGLRFTTQFDASSYILRDHVVRGSPILPGAGVVSMVIDAVRRVCPASSCEVEEICWLRPIALIDQSIRVDVLVEQAEKEIFRVQLMNDQQETYSIGFVRLKDTTAPVSRIEIAQLQHKMPYEIGSQEIYQEFTRAGFAFGPTFKTVQKIQYSKTEVLAQIQLPQETALYSDATLQPYLLDAMLQATLPLSFGEEDSLPFKIARISFHPVSIQKGFVYGTKKSNPTGDGSQYDLFFLDVGGNVLVSVYGFEDRLSRKSPPLKDDSIEQILQLVTEQQCSPEEAQIMIDLLSE